MNIPIVLLQTHRLSTIDILRTNLFDTIHNYQTPFKQHLNYFFLNLS